MKITDFLVFSVVAGCTRIAVRPGRGARCAGIARHTSSRGYLLRKSPSCMGKLCFARRCKPRSCAVCTSTAEQRMQAKAIRERTAATIATIKADSTLTPDQQQVNIEATKLTGHRQFRELLTDQQREKLFRLQRQLAKLQRLLQQ